MAVRRAFVAFGIIATIILAAALRTTDQAAQGAACPPPASAIVFGETVQCSISLAGEQDAFTFTAQGGDRVLVRAVDLSDNAFQPKVELSGPGGLTCSTNGSLLAEVDCTLSGVGTNSYDIVVSDFFSAATANYGLYVQRTNGPAGASMMNFGDTVLDTIATQPGMDAYSFTANGGDRVHMRLADLSASSLQPEIRLYGPTGLICSSNGSVLAKIDCLLTGAGANTYNVVVGDFFGTSAAPYGFYLQRTNVPTQAAVISLGGTVSGAVATPPGMSSYTFSATGGDSVLLRAADFSNSAFQPEIRLYGASGLICTSNGTTLAEVDCVLSGSGANSYIVLVGDFFGVTSGTYGLHAQRTNAPPSGVPITSGQTLSGLVAAVPGTTAYTFSGTGGTTAKVTLIDVAGGSFQPEIRLYGPTGLICVGNGSLSAQVTCGLTGVGTNTYTILAEDFFGALPGYYCVSLNVQSPTCADADTDGVPDDVDNCPAAANTNQQNTDAANTAANRPGADGQGDACDDDIDGDGYTNVQEATAPLAEDPLAYCNIMRADVDGDGAVSILDVTVLAARFLQHVPPAPERYKQDADNAISIFDIADVANVFLQHVSACP